MNTKFYIVSPLVAVIMSSCVSLNGKENPQTATAEVTPQEIENTFVADSFVVGGTTYKFVKVEGGDFKMGASDTEKDMADEDEFPAHNVSVNDFYVAQFEVTQKLWNDVMNEKTEENAVNLPVTNVSWDDCQLFLSKLNAMTGQKFRLPSEAEWEYAARGGKYSKNSVFAGSDNIDDVAWYDGNNGGSIHAVGTKQPNELGLYDMCGNVAEWCNDYYEKNFYQVSPKNNPKGPEKGVYRVLRGGGWFANNKRFGRIANRSGNMTDYRFAYLGLRLFKDVN